ncbi:cell division cycle protein 16 homolog isoform X2 [Amphibalanus amphitrite]|uniref:cell division cycle protein 16 homolog isoform X2 n=1 Tax=Amphibalanus amphitrite TaxID=1232801 RepID=UPI001C90475E|nr:cell division cycle protein 16 homolog isoform X2 [Amphibalanus amphitrite]
MSCCHFHVFRVGTLQATVPVAGSAATMDVEALRAVVQRYLRSHLLDAACYWADKVCSLSADAPQDLVTLAHCYLLTSQPQRAVQLLRRSGRLRGDDECRYLAARGLYETRLYQEALAVLQPELETAPGGRAAPPLLDITDVAGRDEPAHILLLKGRVHEALENRPLAAECYRAALMADVLCHEALVGHQMLTLDEEQKLLEELPFEQQLPAADAAAVRQLYQLQLKKYTAPGEADDPEVPPPLTENNDVLVCRAEQLYYNCDYAQCFKLTSRVLERDPDHARCLPIHLVCLLERRRTNALFQLAHRLVDAYPERALAWFAVGCYYYSVGKMEPARRYLSKATTLDPVFGPAWLAYGHSFALENEHDQAISAYFRGSQLMRGCHLPLLYVGLEYGLTNNARLAQQFFSQALAIAPRDPFVMHELGTILFASRDYAGAERLLTAALEQVQHESHTVAADRWEPLLNNLGHTYRKLGRYSEALEAHERALVLEPQSASTYAAIGYTHALMDEPARAVDAFHKALSLKRDDAFSTQMLGSVLEQLLSSQAVLDSPTALLVPITERGSPTPVTPVVTPAAAAAGGSGVTGGGSGSAGLCTSLRLMDSSDDMSLELDDTK